MSYDEGMNGDLFLLEGECVEKKNYVDKSLVGIIWLEIIHISHKENECLIKETNLQFVEEISSQLLIEECFMEEDWLAQVEDHQDNVANKCIIEETSIEA